MTAKRNRTGNVTVSLAEMEAHASEATQLLKALANEHRLLILCHLAEGEKTVGELNERVLLSQSALSQHLSVLRRDGLVDTRREAQTIHYRLAQGPATRVVETLHEVYCRAAPQMKQRRSRETRT